MFEVVRIGIGGHIAGAVVAERAHRGRALRQRGEEIAAARVIIAIGGGRAGGQRLRGAIADTVIGPVQRGPDAATLLQANRGGVGIGLADARYSLALVKSLLPCDSQVSRIGQIDRYVS